MPRKQTIVKETAAPAASAARAAKPKTPRVKTAHHSKAASVEPEAVAAPKAPIEKALIEKLAYGYWESRGCQGGSPLEDWVRAEREYSQR